jgi:hypothetical protein
MASFAGTEYLANLNAYQDDNDKDRAKIILEGKVADYALGATLRRQGQMRKVGSTAPFEWQDHPLTQDGTLVGDTGAGVAAAIAVTTRYFSITDADTIFTPMDMIGIPYYQDNNTNTSKLIGIEICPIVSISGDVVYVDRNLGSATTTYNVTALISTNINWVRLPAANPEGAASGVARSKAITNRSGQIMFFEKVIQMSRETFLSKIGPKERERLRARALEALNTEIDMAFANSQLSTALVLNGVSRPLTEGLIPRLNTADANVGTTAWTAATDLVRGSGTSRIWNLENLPGEWTLDNLKKFVVYATKYVSDKRVMGLAGELMMLELEGLYTGQTVYAPNDFKNLGFTVKTFETSGGIIDFVHWPPLDRMLQPRGLITVDMDNIAVPYFEDIYMTADIQAKGDQIVKDQYIAKMGLMVSNVLSHAAIFNMPASRS